VLNFEGAIIQKEFLIVLKEPAKCKMLNKM
jgi:hypothetical protein